MDSEDRNQLAKDIERRLDRLRENMGRARRADLSKRWRAAVAAERRHRDLAVAAAPALKWFHLWREARSRRLAERCREELEALDKPDPGEN